MDKYDVAIQRILNSADRRRAVMDDWDSGLDLFQYCDSTGKGDDPTCGCLTLVKGSVSRQDVKPFAVEGDVDNMLALQITVDNRIHVNESELADAIEEADSDEEICYILEAYAEWQRRLDVAIRGVMPEPTVQKAEEYKHAVVEYVHAGA